MGRRPPRCPCGPPLRRLIALHMRSETIVHDPPAPPTSSAPRSAAGDGVTADDRRWWTLAVLVLSLVIVMTANTSLNIAIPSLVRETGASATELQWIVDAYALVFAGLVLTAGAVGDRFGRKGALLGGLVLFGAMSLLATLADDPGHLIAIRAAQGLGAALIMPGTLSILAAVFRPAERPRRSPSGPASPGPALPSASWVAAGCWSTTGGARCSSSTSPSSSSRSPWWPRSSPPPVTPEACRSTLSVPYCRS